MNNVIWNVVHLVTGAGEDECPGVDFVADFAREKQEGKLGCFVEGWWEGEGLAAGREVGG